MPETTTRTGHVVGAVYVSGYWGYTYEVLGSDGLDGVRVKSLKDNPNQRIAPEGEVWAHATSLDISKDKRCTPINHVTSMRPDGTLFHHMPRNV